MCAVFLPGPMIAEARGSIGGTVFSRNRGGAYVRNRSVPTNPGSDNQDAVRQALAAAAAAWLNTLDDEQRSGWDNYGANVPRTNKVGSTINLTGQNWYTGVAVLRERAGLAQVDDAPTVYNRGVNDPTVTALTTDGNATIGITFDDTLDWADTDGAAMLVQIGQPVNPTINYYKGPFNLLGTIDGDGTTPPTSPATLTLPAPLSTDQKVFLRYQILEADGRFNEPAIISTVTI